MLVKELRQGLRTKSFIAVFLTLQALLGVILLSASAIASSDHAGTSISNIIFTFFSIAVLVLQPMRGIGALSSEVKDNTIDMMVLTRLSAWRIVTGKWSAIVTQSALILITIIPYLILRYFFGGMNLLGEIVLLAMIFITSATLTAITVGLSACSSIILRSVLPMVAIPIGAYVLLASMTFSSRGSRNLVDFCALENKESLIGIPLYIGFCAYFGFFILSAGTSLIATYAENHSTRRRIIALAATLVAAVVCSTSYTDPEITFVVMALILVPAFAISLSEFAPLVSPVYSKFRGFGSLGKATALLLLPGWPSGVFFCFFLTLIGAIPFLLNPMTHSVDEFLISSLSLLGTLLFPAILINLLKMKGTLRVSNYILFGFASCILAMVLTGIAESMSSRDILWLFIWIPPVQIGMMAGSFDADAIITAAAIIDTAFFALLLIFAQHEYRSSLSEMEKSLTDTLDPNS